MRGKTIHLYGTGCRLPSGKIDHATKTHLESNGTEFSGHRSGGGCDLVIH